MELIVDGLRKTFPSLEGEPSFSLDLPRMALDVGKVTFILGPNGSGKSVMLKLLSGELIPDKGRVEFQLDGAKWCADKRPCAIVRQEAETSIGLDLTPRENLLLRTRPSTIVDCVFPVHRLKAHVREVLSVHSELSRKVDQPCRNLSAGQRQSLAFLAVASQKSHLLLLDEFLSATDMQTSDFLRRSSREYAIRTPACVLIVSHDLPTALADASRVLLVKRGRLIADLRSDDPNWDAAGLGAKLNDDILT